jgi:heat shock protein HtpX
MFKRVALFLTTNLAIILVIPLILSVFNIQPYLTPHGLNYQSLLIYALIIGFTGSFISLFISKWMAMLSTFD